MQQRLKKINKRPTPQNKQKTTQKHPLEKRDFFFNQPTKKQQKQQQTTTNNKNNNPKQQKQTTKTK